MELLDYTITLAQISIIRDKKSNSQTIHNTFNDLVDKALCNLMRWEGKNESSYRRGQQTNTYLSIGARISKVTTKNKVFRLDDLE